MDTYRARVPWAGSGWSAIRVLVLEVVADLAGAVAPVALAVAVTAPAVTVGAFVEQLAFVPSVVGHQLAHDGATGRAGRGP